MRKTLSDAFFISKIRLLTIRRHLVSYLVVALLTPLGITLIISFAAGITEYAKVNYIIGTIVFSLSLSGINGLGQDIAQDKLMGTLKWFITMPIHPISYVIGLLTPHVIAGFANSLLIMFIGKYVWGAPIHISLVVIPIFILSILSMLGVGAVIGSYSKVPAQAYGLTNLLSFLIILFSPVYYPIEALFPPLRFFAYILPTTYAAQALRYSFKGLTMDALRDITILGAMAALLLIIGLSKIKWRET